MKQILCDVCDKPITDKQNHVAFKAHERVFVFGLGWRKYRVRYDLCRHCRDMVAPFDAVQKTVEQSKHKKRRKWNL